MKANELIKNHGFKKIREIVKKYPDHTHITDDARMFIDENICDENTKRQLFELVTFSELKRLVESHDLVESYDGIESAKMMIERTKFPLSDRIIRLKRAIADVESCMEGV